MYDLSEVRYLQPTIIYEIRYVQLNINSGVHTTYITSGMNILHHNYPYLLRKVLWHKEWFSEMFSYSVGNGVCHLKYEKVKGDSLIFYSESHS